MTAKIAIVGLGQIGASMGLAIKAKATAGGPKVVGHDVDPATVRAAEALGAVDSTTSLSGAVEDAAIVLLCLPLSVMSETLKRIGPHLKDDAVVLDTAPSKAPVMKWAGESLPAGRHYVGLVPTVSPEALGAAENGIKGARADLFRKTVMVIVAPPGTPAWIEELAVNLVRLLGAKPMLTDPVESDGIMTIAHLLPQLTASALLEACLAEPGWAEARKVAGRLFAAITGGMAYYDDPRSLEVAALANRATVVHALDVVGAALKGMRDDIDRGDQENTSERLFHSHRAREQWLDERGAATWLDEGVEPTQVPPFGEHFMQMMFGGSIADRVKPRKGGGEPRT